MAELDVATYSIKKAERSNHGPIFPDERRNFKYYVEQQVVQAVAGLSNTQAASTMALEWTGALGTPARLRQVGESSQSCFCHVFLVTIVY